MFVALGHYLIIYSRTACLFIDNRRVITGNRSIDDREQLAMEAKAIVALALRNGPIEEIHAGRRRPTCADKAAYAHITDDEIKAIMKSAVDRVYHLLLRKVEAAEDLLAVERVCRTQSELVRAFLRSVDAMGTGTGDCLHDQGKRIAAEKAFDDLLSECVCRPDTLHSKINANRRSHSAVTLASFSRDSRTPPHPALLREPSFGRIQVT